MADFEDGHFTALIVDPIKDTIIAYANAPSRLESPPEHLDTGRPGILGELRDRGVNFSTVGFDSFSRFLAARESTRTR